MVDHLAEVDHLEGRPAGGHRRTPETPLPRKIESATSLFADLRDADDDPLLRKKDPQAGALRLNETTSTKNPLATSVMAGPADRLK